MRRMGAVREVFPTGHLLPQQPRLDTVLWGLTKIRGPLVEPPKSQDSLTIRAPIRYPI